MGHPSNHRHFLKDRLPAHIYFDTNFIVNVFFGSTANYYKNLTCRYFIKRLFQSSAKIYFSSIIFPEFWHAILKLETARLYNLESERAVFEKLKKEKKNIVKQIYPMIKNKQKQFDVLMAEFNKEKQRVYVIETEKSIMVEAEKCMQKYCLQSFDAVHLASAEININSASHTKLPVSDIATLDSDFLNIDDNKFSFWCRGCSDLGISNYEKTLPESERLKHDI